MRLPCRGLCSNQAGLSTPRLVTDAAPPPDRAISLTLLKLYHLFASSSMSLHRYLTPPPHHYHQRSERRGRSVARHGHRRRAEGQGCQGVPCLRRRRRDAGGRQPVRGVRRVRVPGVPAVLRVRAQRRHPVLPPVQHPLQAPQRSALSSTPCIHVSTNARSGCTANHYIGTHFDMAICFVIAQGAPGRKGTKRTARWTTTKRSSRLRAPRSLTGLFRSTCTR